MTDIRAALTHRRIQCAIEAMRAIGHDEIRAMTDEEIKDFRDAMLSPWLMTESDLFRRQREAAAIDAEWPDALETAA